MLMLKRFQLWILVCANNNIKIGEGGGMAAVQIQNGKWELVMPTTLTGGEDTLYISDYYTNR